MNGFLSYSHFSTRFTFPLCSLCTLFTFRLRYVQCHAALQGFTLFTMISLSRIPCIVELTLIVNYITVELQSHSSFLFLLLEFKSISSASFLLPLPQDLQQEQSCLIFRMAIISISQFIDFIITD